MKKENGLSMVGAVIAVIIIAIAIICTITIVNNRQEELSDKDIKADMVLIQGKVQIQKKESIAKGTAESIVGAKISDIKDDFLINYFKTLGVIEESDYDKFYRIDDEALEVLNLEVRNQPESLYLANYDSGEVIITRGYNGKYKLSDILKEDQEKAAANETKTEE